MKTLRKTLQDLSGALLYRNEGAADLIEAGTFTAEQHLQIHRNNIYISLTEALSAIYPVVLRLVGEDFFRVACRDYIPEHAPRAAPLHAFGDEFAAFLTRYDPARPLTYIADVARLEWAWHESFHASGAQPFNTSILSQVPIDDHGNLKFKLHPAVRLLKSDYPVCRIWQTNQEDFVGDGGVSLDEGFSYIMIARPEMKVMVIELSQAEFEFLHALEQGLCLDEAFRCANILLPDFDLAVVLRNRVADRTLVDASL